MSFFECLPLVLIMAGVTYLIRMLPLALVRGRLRSRFLRRLLYYVPYAVLSAMTVPAIFTAAGAVIPSVIGCLAGLLFAYKERSLIEVALAASAGAWMASAVMGFLH